MAFAGASGAHKKVKIEHCIDLCISPWSTKKYKLIGDRLEIDYKGACDEGSRAPVVGTIKYTFQYFKDKKMKIIVTKLDKSSKVWYNIRIS